MVWVALGIGSNCESEANLASCLDELLLRFHDLAMSFVFRSEAKDRSGPDYLNMVVGIDTDLPLPDLGALLKTIEDKHRRDRSAANSGRVTIDIDILTYGDKVGTFGSITVPRPDILQAAYVLRPLAQIAGNGKHPALKQSYADLWKAFDASKQALSPVDFVWHERVISRRN